MKVLFAAVALLSLAVASAAVVEPHDAFGLKVSIIKTYDLCRKRNHPAMSNVAAS